jgi:glycosyltransferase involved in cell wall biosynthesis
MSVLAIRGTPVPDAVDLIPVRRWVPERSSLFAHPVERMSLWEHLSRLPGEIAGSGADVFHSPATEPPRRSSIPWVQTVHDATPMIGVAGSSEAAQAWRRRMAPVRLANAVIANSRRTADDAVHYLDVDPDKVMVIPHGVAPAFAPPPERSLPGRDYLLYVGQWGPNKGYAEAFETIARLTQAGRPYILKVAGWVRPDSRSEVENLVARSASPDRIELLDFVPETTLVELYQQAAAVIVTSRYEGFGFPVVEAMACGTPVVAFNNSSLGEVVGDGGLLVEDGDVAAMVSVLETLLADDGVWSRWSDAGLARARRFTWAGSARAHAELFAAVAKGAKLAPRPY